MIIIFFPFFLLFPSLSPFPFFLVVLLTIVVVCDVKVLSIDYAGVSQGDDIYGARHGTRHFRLTKKKKRPVGSRSSTKSNNKN